MRKASESEGGHVAVCVPTWGPPKVLTFHHCLKKATRDQVKEEGGSRSARREIERWMCGGLADEESKPTSGGSDLLWGVSRLSSE